MEAPGSENPVPGPATDLSVVDRGPAHLEIDWAPPEENGEEVAGYRIYRDGEVVGRPNAPPFRDAGLEPETEYGYRVSAVNGAGDEGELSAELTVTTLEQDGEGDDTGPSAPGDLDAEPIGPTEVELSWSAATDPETGVEFYRVYRNGDIVGTPSSPPFRDTGLEPDTEYGYRVSAVNGAGEEGERSDEATATTPEEEDEGDDTAPSVPGDLEGDALGPTEIELSWSAATDAETGVDFYRVFRDGDEVGTPSSSAFRDGGLDPDTEYEYRVSAVNGAGLESEKSEAVEVETPDDPPPAPEDLQAEEVEAREVELTWSESEDPETGIDSYRVFRDGEEVGMPSSASFRDEGLEPATEYAYRVSAVNGAGLESDRSDEITVTTRDDTPPTAPEDLRAEEVESRQVELAWSASEDPETGVDFYRVFRDGDEVGTPSATEFRDTGLQPLTPYSYHVTAVNAEGLESDPSEEITVLTEPFPDDDEDEDEDDDEDEEDDEDDDDDYDDDGDGEWGKT